MSPKNIKYEPTYATPGF